MIKPISCKLTRGEKIVTLPTPSYISFGKERISKNQRALDGTMIIDLIAVKEKCEIVWDILSFQALEKIQAMVEDSSLFFNLSIEIYCKDLNQNIDVSDRITRNAVLINDVYGMDITVFLSDLTYVPYFYDNGFVCKEVTLKLTEK